MNSTEANFWLLNDYKKYVGYPYLLTASYMIKVNR